MNKIEKIKAYLDGMSGASCCPEETKKIIKQHIIPYIDSLKDEPISEDLEKAATEICQKILEGETVAIDGYENVVISDTEKCLKAGAQWKEEQMMANALEGHVSFNNDNYEMGLPDYCVITNEVPKEEFDRRGLKLGDKVKVIIIKNE